MALNRCFNIIARCMTWTALTTIAPATSSPAAAANATDERVTLADLSQDLPENAAAMASSPGAAAVRDAASSDPLIRAAIVLEKGDVVAKYIREDVEPDTPYQVWSTTKSWTSLLVGIMVDNKLLSVDETLGDIFAADSGAWDDVADNETISLREAVTIEEMLTMSSGLISPPDDDGDFEGALTNGGGASLSDSLAYPDIGDKGHFSYLGMSNILSYVVKERTERTPREYLAENVMIHLGIAESEYNWLQNENEVEFAFHGLELTPLQMVKFGQLYLQGGLSGPTTSDEQHRRLISQSWIDASFATHSNSTGIVNAGYGYLFWNLGVWCALGMFGQDICIVPHLERVVVQQRDPDYDNVLLGNFIIAAVAINPALSFDAPPEGVGDSYPSATPTKLETNSSIGPSPTKVENSSSIRPSSGFMALGISLIAALSALAHLC